MSYSYKVVPFTGESRGGLSPLEVAQQLESTINDHVLSGWDFVQLANVNVEVQPGCLAGILGSHVEHVRSDQLIFRSQIEIGAIALPEPVILGRSERPRGSVDERPVPQPHVDVSPKPYQPERLYGGKVSCWNCGSANDPRQIRCAQCENELYMRP